MAITDNLTAALRAEYEAGPATPPDPAIFMGYTEEELRAIVQHYQTMTGLVRTHAVYEPADSDQDIAVLREQQEQERRRLALKGAAQSKAAAQVDWEARERQRQEEMRQEDEKAQADYEIRDYATTVGRVEAVVGLAIERQDATNQALGQAVLDLVRRQMFQAERRREQAEQQIRKRLARRD